MLTKFENYSRKNFKHVKLKCVLKLIISNYCQFVTYPYVVKCSLEIPCLNLKLIRWICVVMRNNYKNYKVENIPTNRSG